MKPEIEKLRKAIDQLLLIQKNYPELKVPENEKKRLVAVVLKILKNEKLSDEELNAFKPYNPEDPVEAEQRILRKRNERIEEQKKATREANSGKLKDIEKMEKVNEKLSSELRVAMADKLPAGGAGKICKKCSKKFTAGDYKLHIKTCKGK